MKSPVLFLIFNRPDTTEKVFEEIRKARPPRLYVAADGPRKNKEGEKELCERTRAIVNNVDWPCEVKTLFRDENLGCGKAVSQAITWFFDNEPEGIILEDDILPHPDFFKYCDELLEKYRDDDRVGSIGGHNLLYTYENNDASYGFLALCHIWGWASWKRAWKDYEFDLPKKYSFSEIKKALKEAYQDRDQQRYWENIYKLMAKGKVDTWDYQWAFSQICHHRLSAIPYVNLTKNIGFNSNSTHTSSASEQELNLVTQPIYPLKHPIDVIQDIKAESIEKINANIQISLLSYIKKTIKRMIKNVLHYNK